MPKLRISKFHPLKNEMERKSWKHILSFKTLNIEITQANYDGLVI